MCSAGPAAPPGSPREALRLPSVEESEFGVRSAVRACGHPFSERTLGLLTTDAFCLLAGYVASADVDVLGVPSAEAVFKEPVRRGWSGCEAALTFLFAAFFVGDPPADLVEVLLRQAFGEAQHLESRRRSIVHAFDSMIGA